MTDEQKNVLLLIADDLGKYAGCYGNTTVKTPNLDKLASQGVAFDAAFASTASCSGSRSTIYTGLHTHENGQYGLNIFRTHFQTFPHIETLPGIFNDHGYRTGIIGKVHVGPDATYPWQYRVESETRDVAWVADNVERFLEDTIKSRAAFCLTVGFVDPHRDIQTRGGFGNEISYDPRVKSLHVSVEDVEVPDWLPDAPEVRTELAEYYQAIDRMDQGVGLILQALDSKGLLEKTLVVFLSDNGPPFMNAKTTLYEAGVCLPLILRVPDVHLGIRNPNLVSFIDILPTLLDWAGIQASKPAGGYNVPSSGVAAEGKESPPRLGRSVLPILHKTNLLPPQDWKQLVFGSHTFHELQNYWPTRVLRTPKYKYHRNVAWQLDFPFASDLYASLTFEAVRNANPPMIGKRSLKDYLLRPSEELFDIEEDPDEIHNLAGDPAHNTTLAALRLQLEQWQLDTRDLWLFRDGCSFVHLSRYSQDGLRVPNQFDINIKNPTSKGVELIGLELHKPLQPLSVSRQREHLNSYRS